MEFMLYIIWSLIAVSVLLLFIFIYKPKAGLYIMWALSAAGALPL